MMDVIKALNYLENSFLSFLLLNSNITDISYNGESFFYLDNNLGRQKSDIVVDPNIAKDFIRQIANLSERQFSYQTPILDVSIGKYRINAIHQSIGRKNNLGAITFSIRIAKDRPIITKESGIVPIEVIELLSAILDSHLSLVIGGLTGSGKTEFQKFLISLLPDNSRLIVIDNVLELDNLGETNNLDINTWQIDDRNESFSIQSMVKNALRSNPDWLIVAESRGKEMLEVLNSAMTGHPIFTTIHSLDLKSMPNRIAQMVMMNDLTMDYDLLLKDIYYHFRIYIYLKRDYSNTGSVVRYISEIAEIDENGQFNTLYFNDGIKASYFRISSSLLTKLNTKNLIKSKSLFLGDHS